MLSASGASAPTVALESLELKHADAMSRWVTDPEIALNVGIRGPVSLESTREWITQAQADDTRLAFAICLDGRHVGNIVLDRVDRAARDARLSIYLGDPGARGRGVGRTAVRLALDEAFGPQDLGRVWLIVHTENAPAIAAYESAGFVTEQVLPGDFELDGRQVDALRMTVTRATRPPR